MNILKILTLTFILCLFYIGSFADSIRGPVVEKLMLTSDSDFQKQIALSWDEITYITLNPNNLFLKGIQIEIALSENLKHFADSFAIVIYDQLSGDPKIGTSELIGKKVFFQVLPVINKLFIKIPIEKSSYNSKNLAIGTYALSEPVKQKDFPVCFVIQSIMKGIPNKVYNSKFHVIITPDLEKKGIAEINIRKPKGMENESIDILIDGETIEENPTKQVMETGIHTITIKSLQFKEENTSFTIESGKSIKVNIDLEYQNTALIIDAPKVIEIFIDGGKIDFKPKTEIPIIEGEHTIMFKIENQTISRKINVKNGKKYSISLFFDVEIKED
jgi:hypothetical protein